VVAVNRFAFDTPEEFEFLRDKLQPLAVRVVQAEHWAKGAAGAEALAKSVVELAERPGTLQFLYADELPLLEKIRVVATKIYGAGDIAVEPQILAQIQALQTGGYGHYPVCIAKTPYSFSADASLRGAPSGHILKVREVQLRAGAEFVVALCGDVRTMPGLPKIPAAGRIDLDDSGRVIGLS